MHYRRFKKLGDPNRTKSDFNLANPVFSITDQDLTLIKWQLTDTGYAKKNHQYAHRIVLARKLNRELTRDEVCDHINRNKLDNSRNNLRLADKSLNSVNRAIRSDNKTGFVGVHKYWPKEWQNRDWKPSYTFTIQRKGHKTFYSGYYKSAQEANEARLTKLEGYNY